MQNIYSHNSISVVMVSVGIYGRLIQNCFTTFHWC